MPQLDISTWPSQLFWLAITFFALYFVVSRIAIPRTGAVIEQRKSTIEGDLAEAQRLRVETDKAAKAYEESLAAARSKAGGIGLEARAKISSEAEAERAAVDAKLGEKIAAAEAKIAESRLDALSRVAAVAEELAGSIVSEFTGNAASAAAVSDAVAKAAK